MFFFLYADTFLQDWQNSVDWPFDCGLGPNGTVHNQLSKAQSAIWASSCQSECSDYSMHRIRKTLGFFGARCRRSENDIWSRKSSLKFTPFPSRLCEGQFCASAYLKPAVCISTAKELAQARKSGPPAAPTPCWSRTKVYVRGWGEIIVTQDQVQPYDPFLFKTELV